MVIDVALRGGSYSNLGADSGFVYIEKNIKSWKRSRCQVKHDLLERFPLLVGVTNCCISNFFELSQNLLSKDEKLIGRRVSDYRIIETTLRHDS